MRDGDQCRPRRDGHDQSRWQVRASRSEARHLHAPIPGLLLSTKVLELETNDALKRRVDEAARVIDLDRLGLCPQCGFATLYRYDRMGIDLQERKLELLVATARDIWG